MIKVIRLSASIFLLAFSSAISAQYLQPTQLLSNPFLMCPAQVGNSESPRASLMYKNDWSGSCLAGFDAPLKKLHGGGGLYAVYENSTFNRERLTAQGIYSYRWNINDNFRIRTAAYVGTVYTHQGDYVFQDSSHYFNVTHSTNFYFDEGLSLAFDYKKLSFGGTCFHLLRSDIGTVSTYRLDRTFSFYIGYDLWMMKGERHKGIGISPLLYLSNEESDLKFTIGFDFVWNNIFAGAYYRAADLNIVTLIYHAGARVGRFQFGYAYDNTRSELLMGDGSGHEVFLNYFFEKE
ncbi:Type IX secretion system membrane protein PorP/SprF [anaerobic digester metagenome]